jgi:hypothetical protein
MPTTYIYMYIVKKKSNFQIVRVFCATIFFFDTFKKKKSYLSLSTDYTYKFLVNGQIGVEVSPGHCKFKFQRFLKNVFYWQRKLQLYGPPYMYGLSKLRKQDR